VISFDVEGHPVTQGSMKVINGRVLHSRGEALILWRTMVALAARKAGAFPVPNPVEMTIEFRLARPKTVKRNLPYVAPDLDKLIRAVLDALTGIAYVDDGQVVSINSSKVYGEPGVSVSVISL
jgi:Holliday junction resolvase RusA-like endonuclease